MASAPSSRTRDTPDGFCPHCLRSLDRYGRCRRRSCSGYVRTWLRHTALKVRANLDRWEWGTRMVTVTAPGKPKSWHRKGRPSLPHEAVEGGGWRVCDSPAAAWNSSAPDRLSAMFSTARKRLLRERPDARLHLLSYVSAFQKRGVLHFHIAYGFKSQRECNDLERFLEIIRAPDADRLNLLDRYGFGRQFDTGEVRQGGKWAASYMVRYLTAEHQGLERVLASPQAPSRPVYVSRELMAQTGFTMRFMRWRSWCWREIGVTSLDFCVKLYRLVLALQDGIAASHRHRLREALASARQPIGPPVVSTRSLVQGAQIALAF